MANLYDDPLFKQLLAEPNGYPDNQELPQGASYIEPANYAPDPLQPVNEYAYQEPDQSLRTMYNQPKEQSPATTTTQEQPKMTSMFDLIKKQEPVEDVALQERARKAALMSGIGQVFGNLAGAVMPGQDSRIPLLQPDRNIQNLYGIVDKEKTKYDALKRDWNARLGQSQYQDEQMSLANRKLQQQQEYLKDKDRTANAKWLAEMTLKDKGMDMKGENDAAKLQISRDANNIRRAGVGVQAARAEASIQKANKPFFNYTEHKTGKSIPMTQAEFYTAYNDALNESATNTELAANFKVLEGTFKTQPLEAAKQIVTFYKDLQQKQMEAKQAAKAAADAKIAEADLDKRRQFTSNLGKTAKPAAQPPPTATLPAAQTDSTGSTSKADKWVKKYARKHAR